MEDGWEVKQKYESVFGEKSWVENLGGYGGWWPLWGAVSPLLGGDARRHWGGGRFLTMMIMLMTMMTVMMVMLMMMMKATWMVGGRGIEGKDCLHRCNISFPPISIEPSGDVGVGPGGPS